MSIEAAAKILHNRSPKCYDTFGDEEGCRCVSKATAAIAAFAGDRVLYAEPYGCRHRTFMYVHGTDICSDCGAAQRWVVRVWPEVATHEEWCNIYKTVGGCSCTKEQT